MIIFETHSSCLLSVSAPSFIEQRYASDLDGLTTSVTDIRAGTPTNGIATYSYLAPVFAYVRGYDQASRPVFEQRKVCGTGRSPAILSGDQNFGDAYQYDHANRLTMVIREVGTHTTDHERITDIGTFDPAGLESGIGMNLAENLARDYPQVVPEAFTSNSKKRWAADLKILFQRKDIALPRDRELVGQIQSIKRRVLASGKVSFDAERTTRGGHAERFWAIALACQKERGPAAKTGVRVVG